MVLYFFEKGLVSKKSKKIIKKQTKILPLRKNQKKSM